MNPLQLALVPLLAMSAAAADLRVVHYNIKELDSKKLAAPGEQLAAVKKVLAERPFDVLEVEEMQYDLPGVPDPSFQTAGMNARRLFSILLPEADPKAWFFHFEPSNMGSLATMRTEVEYYTDPGDQAARDNADNVNFGLFPAQYSTALISRFPVLYTKVYSKLRWKDFNPGVDLGSYSGNVGKPMPAQTELFNNNFNDVAIDVDGETVHVIALHTIPAFHFGNMKTPNYDRNRDQLRFLEWYVTGETDIPVKLPGVEPLPKGAKWVAMGDWNVDVGSSDDKQVGVAVLKRLFKKVKRAADDGGISYQYDGFKKSGFQARLDYIVYGGLNLKEGGVVRPEPNREELGCGAQRRGFEAGFGRVERTYGKDCAVVVDEAYATVKAASDHFPLWAVFSVR